MNPEENNENYESDSSISESEIENTIEESKLRKQKNAEYKLKKQKERVIKSVKTSDPEIEVELKSKITKKKPRKIVIYKEDLEEEEEEFEIVQKQKKAGRPKKPKIVKYMDKNNNETDDRLKSEQVIIDTSHTKELSEKELKILKLEERLAELEAVSGKKLRGTKKGNPDKRQVKPRTQKQIEASERLVAFNKAKREAKLKDNTKSAVKEIITELSTKQKQEKVIEQKVIEKAKPKYDPMTDPYL